MATCQTPPPNHPEPNANRVKHTERGPETGFALGQNKPHIGYWIMRAVTISTEWVLKFSVFGPLGVGNLLEQFPPHSEAVISAGTSSDALTPPPAPTSEKHLYHTMRRPF